MVTKYSSERFLSSHGQKMSKHFLSSVLQQRSDHCLKTYKSALIDGINNAQLMKPNKKKTNKYQMQQNYSSLPVEMQLVKVRPETLRTFQPSYASSKAK